MSTSGTWSGPWLGLEGRVPPPQHRARKPVGMFGIRSLWAALQLASTCSPSPPFFCPPKHNRTAAYKHRILCNINWVCYEGHITTMRAEEAYRYSITIAEQTNGWHPQFVVLCHTTNSNPHIVKHFLLCSPLTLVLRASYVVVYVHVRESWVSVPIWVSVSVQDCNWAGTWTPRTCGPEAPLTEFLSWRSSVNRIASVFIKWKQQQRSHCFFPCSFLVQISAQCPVS